MQLRFRHGSLQPEQQAVIIGRRIIDAIDIGDQGVEQRADFQQLMPVPAGARQPRHLRPQHQPNMAQTHLRHQALEAETALDRRPGSPEVVIDGENGLAWPAELEGPIRQRILQARRLPVAQGLLHRRLANIDDRQPVAMAPCDLV